MMILSRDESCLFTNYIIWDFDSSGLNIAAIDLQTNIFKVTYILTSMLHDAQIENSKMHLHGFNEKINKWFKKYGKIEAEIEKKKHAKFDIFGSKKHIINSKKEK